MASNLSGFTWDKPHFKHDMEPRSGTKHTKKKAKADALATAYEVVNKRDRNMCRVTGVVLHPLNIVSDKYQREHHHLRGRNAAPELREEPSNIILCSKLVHGYLQKDWIVVEGEDANGPLRFHWADSVKPEQRIFQIASRRKSQQMER